MKARSAKAKGTRLEKEIAKILVDSGLDQYAMRMPLSGAIKGLKQDILTKLPLAIECKNQETTKFHEWYKQAEADNNIGARKIPVVVWSKNHLTRNFAFLDFQDLVNILYYAMRGGMDKE